jgi:asparagine synthase (glutamine-hydrolysing)
MNVIRPSATLIHWDGRIDNRGDLLLRLGDSLRGDTRDSTLALTVFERWGIDGFAHLIGDWSLVIRDHSNRSVILASDFAGVRPLYYSVQREGVLWSDRLRSLVESTGISDLDDQYIRGFLAAGGCPNRTPYKSIYSVAPGNAVCVSPGKTEVQRFWSLPAGDMIRYRNPRRYEEHYRELFREAIAVRLQDGSPVLAELSGGLDSSSVVCVANHLIQSGAVSASELNCVSFVCPDSLDEPFIREVESHCAIQSTRICTQDHPVIAESRFGDAIPQAFHPLNSAVAANAHRLGAKTVLTGQAGDLLNGNWFDDSLQVAAALRRFQLGKACCEGLAWSRILHLPVYGVLWRGVQTTLPAALTPVAIYTAPDGSYNPKSTETSLLSGSGDRECFFSSAWMQAPPERRKYFCALSRILELRTLQAPESIEHLDYSHPFTHRPLLEFLLTVPADVLCRPGEPRRLMRSALSHLWPARLRTRRSKAVFTAPWREALRPIVRGLLARRKFCLVDGGFLDGSSVVSRLERFSAGLDCNESQLRNIILLELWLHNRLEGAPSEQVLQAA